MCRPVGPALASLLFTLYSACHWQITWAAHHRDTVPLLQDLSPHSGKPCRRPQSITSAGMAKSTDQIWPMLVTVVIPFSTQITSVENNSPCVSKPLHGLVSILHSKLGGGSCTAAANRWQLHSSVREGPSRPTPRFSQAAPAMGI